MDRLKTFGIYILMIIGMYIFSSLLIFIFFNLNYKDISNKDDIPEQIIIEKAETKKHEGRIYGYVQNKEENNLNGKFIKVEILNINNEVIDTQYINIDNIEQNEKKMFKIYFKVENAKYYNIYIVESENS